MKKCFAFLLLMALVMLPTWLAAEETSGTEARRLFNALGCKGCHLFEGQGGSLAPALDDIGSRMTRSQIIRHLEAHAEARGPEFMPSYSTTSKEELELLSDFLYTHK